MCYAIPGKIKRIEGKKVVVDYFGEEKRALNEFHQLKVGDYVSAQGGFVIKKVEPQDAKDTLVAWKELFFELQEIDLQLSRLKPKDKKLNKDLSRILDKALEGYQLKKEELLYLLEREKPDELNMLYASANFLRQKYHKNSCCIHGIIEISNHCSKSCQYCGITLTNQRLKRYRMSPEEIVSAACEAVEKYGFQALVLQSGEDPVYKVEDLATIIGNIKKKVPVLICVSFGEVGLDGLEKLYQSGARALLMRFETSNPELFKKLHPGQTLDSRLAHLRRAQELGYIIISGGLIGLPGQTKEDLINDILLAKDLRTEMYSFGPFLAHPETPLADSPKLSENEVLKVLALARLIDPEKAKILVTTAFETLSLRARKTGLSAGANSVMLNVTPETYRKKYDIYPDKVYSETSLKAQITETIDLLKSLGRAPTDLGVSQ